MRWIAVRWNAVPWIATLTLTMAGCSSDMEPAQRRISDIDRTLRSAAPEAAQYVPDQLRDVRRELVSLQEAFARDDYAAVLRGAPVVLRDAQELSGASAASRNALLKALNGAWASLAAAVPDDVAAVQSRIDLLGRTPARRPTGIDLDAARANLSHGASLWSKAQAAFATGNMDEAVSIAKALESQLQGLAGSLNVELSESAAAPPHPAAEPPESAGITAPGSPR